MSSGEPLGMVITTSGVVGQVRDEGQAAKAGMAPGCKIIMVGDQNVSNLEEIKAAVQAIRARGDRFYTLKYKVQLASCVPITTLSLAHPSLAHPSHVITSAAKIGLSMRALYCRVHELSSRKIYSPLEQAWLTWR